MMSAPERQELIRNAVAFLSDPKTQGSSLQQRVSFLEAKGLTGPEIEEALRQATMKNVSEANPYMPIYSLPPTTQQARKWDWRDYFITGILSGCLVYASASLFRKYLLPHLQPPSSTAYEADVDALTAQFDAAEALLKDVHAETVAVRAAVEHQNARIDEANQEVEAFIKEMRESEVKFRDEMREIRDEISSVRDMLPKTFDKIKDNHARSLTELQGELNSLKALLLGRNPVVSQTTTSIMPEVPGRPSIPAWQLASTSSNSSEQ